jgi:hypothetical protein
MARKPTPDLIKFLRPFPEAVKATALGLRSFVLSQVPMSYELIYDNYNALAIGYSVSERVGDVFCSIAVYSKYVNLGLNRGAEIPDPESRFAGSGKLYRYLTVRSREDFPHDYVKRLLKRAYKNSLARIGQTRQARAGITITKSVSPAKRRPK